MDEIERWRVEKKERVCFVTFNYDTMLEEAMRHVLRLGVRDMSSYIKWENYSLFKLHGSVDWGRVIEGINAGGRGGPMAFYEHIVNTVRPDNSSVSQNYERCTLDMSPNPNTGATLFPAISIPVENKDEFSCPSGHIEVLKEMLPKVTKLITIGWRATEDKFLEMLQDSRSVIIDGIRNPVNLLIVSGTQQGAELTAKNLGRFGDDPSLPRRGSGSLINEALLGQREFVPTGFTGLINNLDTLRVFLRSK